MTHFYNKTFTTLLKEYEQEEILEEIKKLIPKDEIVIYNKKEIEKHTFHIFHIINQYHSTYTKSKREYKEERENSLASLGKGNERREKRLNKNKEILENKNSSDGEKLIAFFENGILNLILEGRDKLANLILGIAYIYKDYVIEFIRELFKYKKDYSLALESLNESLNFFRFTYMTPTKIVNSLAILLYYEIFGVLQLKDEEKGLRFIRYIINFYFKEHAPQKIRKDSFNKEIYCAGIYDSLPIFHWNTGNNKSYKKEDIKYLSDFFQSCLKDEEIKKYFISLFLVMSTESIKVSNITNIDETFVKNFIKLFPLIYLIFKQKNELN